MADQIEEMMQIGKRKKREEIKERKKTNGKWGKRMKGKRLEKRERKGKTDRGQNILKIIE